MNPVTISDIALFMQSLLDVFGNYIVYMFSIMVFFSIAFFVKRILVGGH